MNSEVIQNTDRDITQYSVVVWCQPVTPCNLVRQLFTLD